jgi:hypothetical protein
VTETSKVVDVLLLLGGKQHSYAQGHMLCLDYTLCLMQLSIVRNLIIVEFLDWFTTSGLLVIDAVGWRSMYLVVMPRVNLIVILSTYARCLYSINYPTVICLPSMYYFILWRDTISELSTPVLFPSYCYHLFTLLALFTLVAYYYYSPLDTLIPLFIANLWDWQPHRKLGAKYLVVLCAGSTLLLVEDGLTSVANGALVGVSLGYQASPLVVLAPSSPDRHTLGS